jgi:hypothetical protein
MSPIIFRGATKDTQGWPLDPDVAVSGLPCRNSFDVTRVVVVGAQSIGEARSARME